MSELTIKNPSAKDVPVLKAMWKETFRDDDRFIDLFFKSKFSFERSLAVYDSDKPVSMLFFPSYDICVGGRKSRAGYILGAATKDAFRGQGIMFSLLCEAHDRMRAQGDEYSLLIPADEGLYGFYEKSGYMPLIKKRIIEHNVSGGENIKVVPATSVNDIMGIYEDAKSYLCDAVLQSRESYTVVIEDFLRSGRLLLIGDFGYAFVSEQGGRLIVSELILDSRSANDSWKINAVMNKIGRRFSYKNITCCCPPSISDLGHLENAGMIKSLKENSDFGSETIYMSMMLD